MPSPFKTFGEVIRQAVDDPDEEIAFSDGYVEARVATLLETFRRVREGKLQLEPIAQDLLDDDAEYLNEELDKALMGLPEQRRDGWRAGAKAALKISVGGMREAGVILVDAARDLLPRERSDWQFVAPAAARSPGNDVTVQAFSASRPGTPSVQVAIEKEGTHSRLSVTVSDFPIDAPIPVLLVIGLGAEAAQTAEVDPVASGTTLQRRLRYERLLPAGDYLVFLGNSRMSA